MLAARLMNDEGQIDPEIVVVIAGETVDPQRAMNTPLFKESVPDTPEVMFIPPLVGG
jgi:hypothetical protein